MPQPFCQPTLQLESKIQKHSQPIFSHFRKFEATLIFFSFDQILLSAPIFEGGTKSKNHFRAVFLPFQAISNNLDFFSFFTKISSSVPIFLGWGEGGKKIQKSFLTNFLAISENLEQFRFF